MSNLKGKTILVVEDNKTINRQLTAIISKTGAVVIQAVNGEDACEKAAINHPDIILMDVQMPIMDGYDATMRIKSAEETKNIPIIMLTGNKDKEDVEKGIRCGVAAYLTKPAPGKKIIETMLEYL